MKAVVRCVGSLFPILLPGYSTPWVGSYEQLFVLEEEWRLFPKSTRTILQHFKKMGFIQFIDEEQVDGATLFQIQNFFGRGVTSDDCIVFYFCMANELELITVDSNLAAKAKEIGVRTVNLDEQSSYIEMNIPNETPLDTRSLMPPWLSDNTRSGWM